MIDSSSRICSSRRAPGAAAPWTLLVAGLLLLPEASRAQWQPSVPDDCPSMPGDPAEARAVAGEQFRAAVASGEEGNWQNALGLFSCSYSIVPHPNTLYNMGMAAERIGDLETADHALARCLAEAPDATYRADAEALLESVRERRAAPAPTETTTLHPIDTPGEPSDAAGGAGPGQQAEGAAAEGSAVPPPDGMSAMTIAGWSLLGAGVAVAVAGGTAFAVLSDDEGDASLLTTVWSDASELRDRAKTYSGASTALFVIGGAAAIAGTVLLLLDVEEDAPVLPIASASGESVGLAVVGRF
jgi:hypothetical protein